MSELSEKELRVLRHVSALSRVGAPLIISGGWAARLLRLHPWAAPVDFEALRTKDLDVAVIERSPGTPGALLKALEEEGFVAELRGDERPPLSRYLLNDEPEFELEFITALVGGARSRDGQSLATVDVLGVVAQRTRHVEVLLADPWSPEIPGTDLHVAAPARYLLQKLLSLPNRKRFGKKAKDAVYIHDVLHLFQENGAMRPALVEQASQVRAGLSSMQVRRLFETKALLENEESQLVKDAVNQLRSANRVATAESFATFCRLSLSELIGAGTS